MSERDIVMYVLGVSGADSDMGEELANRLNLSVETMEKYLVEVEAWAAQTASEPKQGQTER